MKLGTYLIMALFGFLILVGVLLLFLAGTREEEIVLQEEVDPPQIIKTEEKEEKKEDIPVNDKDLFRVALLKREKELCSKIQEETLQDECWDAILLAKGVQEVRESHCEKMKNSERKQYCHDQISLEIVKLQNDFDRCDRIKDKTILDRCHKIESRSKIMKVSSTDDCADIPTKGDRNLCEDFFITKEISLAKNPTKTMCQDLSEEGDRHQCELGLAIEEAMKTLDSSACRKLSEPEMQKSCVKQMQKKLQLRESSNFMSTGNVEGCDGFSDANMKQYCRDRAITTRAIDDYTPQICNKIKNDTQREICTNRATNAANIHFYNIAKSKKDERLCEFIPNEDAKDSCKKIISAEKKNVK